MRFYRYWTILVPRTHWTWRRRVCSRRVVRSLTPRRAIGPQSMLRMTKRALVALRFRFVSVCKRSTCRRWSHSRSSITALRRMTIRAQCISNGLSLLPSNIFKNGDEVDSILAAFLVCFERLDCEMKREVSINVKMQSSRSILLFVNANFEICCLPFCSTNDELLVSIVVACGCVCCDSAWRRRSVGTKSSHIGSTTQLFALDHRPLLQRRRRFWRRRSCDGNESSRLFFLFPYSLFSRCLAICRSTCRRERNSTTRSAQPNNHISSLRQALVTSRFGHVRD
jgi:hypothetical protein